MTQRVCEVCGGIKREFRRLFIRNGHEFFRCRSCRLIRIDPQPNEAILAGIYGSKYHYDAWGMQTSADRVMQLKKETFRKHVLDIVDLKKGARILDCGAAFGALMEVAAEAGLETYGIELTTEAAAAIARRFGPERIFSGAFEAASFQDLDEDAFDCVFMCDFIEHVRDPLAVLKKTSRLLKTGGQLVITTPDTCSPSCRLMRAGWPHYNVEHLYCFNRNNLTKLLQRAGFMVTRTGPARKVVTMEYIRDNLNARPRALVTPTVNLLARCVGRRLSNWQASFTLGQMLVVGLKDAQPPRAPDAS